MRKRRPAPDINTVLLPSESTYFDSESGEYCGPMLGDGIRELIFEASLYPEDRFQIPTPRDKWRD